MLNKEVMRKLKDFYTYVQSNNGQIGTKVRGIDVNCWNTCNFKCKHCFTQSPGNKDNTMLDANTLASVADQAHALGIFEFDLQGGELLLFPDKLFEIIQAIDPSRFYLYLTTNGYLLDTEMAKKLKEAGVSRVSVSVDSMWSTKHDEFRGKAGAWSKALYALEAVKIQGIDPYLNITVYHGCDWDNIDQLCKYSKERGYSTLINVAVPSGKWQGKYEVMVDEEDRKRLIEMRKKYNNLIRDIWNPFDKENEKVLGCNCVNRTYITPKGDILVCPYVHIKIGNIHDNALAEVIEKGFSCKRFREHSDLCLGGEDKEFVKECMGDRDMSIFNPKPVEEVC